MRGAAWAVVRPRYDLNENAGPHPFNAHFAKPNPRQRWAYFSDMTEDESLVFLTYVNEIRQYGNMCVGAGWGFVLLSARPIRQV